MRTNLRKIGHNKSFSRNDKVLWIKHRRTRTINWDAIGAIGEIVGALGVIVTVGYLAIQVRQNTFASRAQTYQERTNASRDLIRWSVEPSMLQALYALPV